MAVLQFKTALLILGAAAGRKHLIRSFCPHTLECLWMLIGIRLLLPQDIGIPILSIPHSPEQYSYGPAAGLADCLVWIHRGGTGIALLILLADYICFYNRMKQKEVLQNEFVCRWSESHSCRPHFYIYTSPAAVSPIVYGLLCPKIVLPAQQYSAAQYEYILLHEWMHIRRLDLWKKVFMITAAVLNWYNPACWLMLLLFNRDLELA